MRSSCSCCTNAPTVVDRRRFLFSTLVGRSTAAAGEYTTTATAGSRNQKLTSDFHGTVAGSCCAVWSLPLISQHQSLDQHIVVHCFVSHFVALQSHFTTFSSLSLLSLSSCLLPKSVECHHLRWLKIGLIDLVEGKDWKPLSRSQLNFLIVSHPQYTRLSMKRLSLCPPETCATHRFQQRVTYRNPASPIAPVNVASFLVAHLFRLEVAHTAIAAFSFTIL